VEELGDRQPSEGALGVTFSKVGGARLNELRARICAWLAHNAKMEGSDRERKRRISAELEPQQGEEQEEDVIGPMPAEPARGTKKRKGEQYVRTEWREIRVLF